MERAVVNQYIKAIKDLGAEIIDAKTTGRNHYKLVVATHGKTRFFTASNSSSDHRHMKNFAADVRRWLKEIQ